MNLAKLAESLGLPKDSPEEKVFGALATRDAEGRAAVESLAALTGQLPEMGLKLDGKSLVRVEPLKLDIQDGDSEEVKNLKAELAKNRLEKQISDAKVRKELVTKLSADLKLPPALMALANEVLSIPDQMEALMLSKDGKGIELARVKDIPSKIQKLLQGVVDLKGTRTATPTAETDEAIAAKEREKLAKELSARTGGKAAEELAKK